MSTTSAQTATFRMTVSDAYDGAIRILTDAQRFGFELISLDLQPAKFDCGADMRVVLSSTRCFEHKLLTKRFIRHPTVLRVYAADEHEDCGHADSDTTMIAVT
jgi:hypothetical protein